MVTEFDRNSTDSDTDVDTSTTETFSDFDRLAFKWVVAPLMVAGLLAGTASIMTMPVAEAVPTTSQHQTVLAAPQDHIATGFGQPTGPVDANRLVNTTIVVPTVAGTNGDVSGYEITITKQNSTIASTLTQTTDQNGHARFTDLTQGDWKITVKNPDRTKDTVTFSDLTARLPLVNKDGSWAYDSEITLKVSTTTPGVPTTQTTTVTQPPITVTPPPDSPNPEPTPSGSPSTTPSRQNTPNSPQQQQQQPTQNQPGQKSEQPARTSLPVTGVQLGLILLGLLALAVLSAWLFIKSAASRRAEEDEQLDDDRDDDVYDDFDDESGTSTDSDAAPTMVLPEQSEPEQLESDDPDWDFRKR